MQLSIDVAGHSTRSGLDEAMRLERAAFAAKVRVVRAILGLSQDEFGHRVGLTQRSVHRIERGEVEPKLRTVLAIQRFWFQSGIAIEDLPDGGFRLDVTDNALLGRSHS